MSTRDRRRRTAPARQAGERGASLIELMVALTLGLMVVLTGLMVLINARITSTAVVDTNRLQVKAESLMRLLGTHLSQAGAVELADGGGGLVSFSSEFTGYPLGTSGGSFIAVHGVDGGTAASDTLRVSYEDDGSTLDCQGNRTATPKGSGDSRIDHEFTHSAAGELLCRGANGTATVALAHGIEDFQVTYTLRTVTGGTASFRRLTANQLTAVTWPAVTAVTICLRVAGELSNLAAGAATPGCRDGESVPADGRARRVIQRTFALRNALP
jgi:type IV pilus assembly protein PilW